MYANDTGDMQYCPNDVRCTEPCINWNSQKIRHNTHTMNIEQTKYNSQPNIKSSNDTVWKYQKTRCNKIRDSDQGVTHASKNITHASKNISDSSKTITHASKNITDSTKHVTNSSGSTKVPKNRRRDFSQGSKFNTRTILGTMHDAVRDTGQINIPEMVIPIIVPPISQIYHDMI